MIRFAERPFLAKSAYAGTPPTDPAMAPRPLAAPPRSLVAPFYTRHAPFLRVAKRLARHASAALADEANLTPKPGLVDKHGSGSHHDMTLAMMHRSIGVLEPWFGLMAQAALVVDDEAELRDELGYLGRLAEAQMMAATDGVNTHRGAIWALGLLVAAAAHESNRFESHCFEHDGLESTGLDSKCFGLLRLKPGRLESNRLEPHRLRLHWRKPGCLDPERVAQRAARLAQRPDRRLKTMPDSKGKQARQTYGVGGARAQACAGFPAAIASGLPQLHRSRQAQTSENAARLDALMAIMVQLDDTCVLARGGRAALHTLQEGARTVLTLGGAGTLAGRHALHQLCTVATALHVSPGGAADLLAATLFLDRLCPEHPISGARPWKN